MTVCGWDHAEALARIRTEINLVEVQLRRSREARSKYSIGYENNTTGCAKETLRASSVHVGPRQEVLSLSLPSTPYDEKLTLCTEEAQSPLGRAPVAARKEGTILHLEKGSFGREKFVSRFLLVDEHEGVMLYESQKHRHSSVSRPLGHVPFSKETRNSRGSRVKKAAVCWPRILPEDCPKAADLQKKYFAIEYLNEKDVSSKLIFAAESDEERDEWVHFITRFIDVFLAPRAGSENLQHTPRALTVPRRCSGFSDGGAPDGNAS
ncbi:hypothetical protein MOQ_002719 [Trypanosoma cruzi marinkellei]|uniref:PH domain-containing protein n=1 Tax=Trypanosoma cruzi marinkellei TaxID=85056 RepID=K2N1P3_TRYCR|nr:hypothetical protein MOQ_002719 [Trypanosoma cruzi marinkellei]